MSTTYFNINQPSEIVSFKTAAITGQGQQKGLYFPSKIPQYTQDEMKHLINLSVLDLAFRIMKPFTGNDLPDEILYAILEKTIHFDFPLVNINKQISVLELFHGPTLAFKDVGAKFMSETLSYFNKDNDKKVTVLVATSGDTGGAVAHGFYEAEHIDVIILYPSKKVSSVQEMQLTRLGKNIQALEIDGTFDDCQHLVKMAFADADINQQYQLTSANSINIARWLPQQLYYVLAVKKWLSTYNELPVVTVPSGNFGNICAGLLAWKQGLPIQHMIAACNANDYVHQYLMHDILKSKQTIPTLSNAMDVGLPSNFIRIQQLFNYDRKILKNALSSTSISDEETKETIKQVWNNFGYMLEPHGAVAYKAFEQYLATHTSAKGFILETAHPVKFPEIVEDITKQHIELPKQVMHLLERPKQSIFLDKDFTHFKAWLLSKK